MMNAILFYIIAPCVYLGIGIIVTAAYIVLGLIESDTGNMIAGVFAWPLLLVLALFGAFLSGLIFLVKKVVRTLERFRKGE